MNHLLKKEIFLVILCLLIGFVLRFYTFDKKSLWIDEIYTFNDSRDNLKGQLQFYQKDPTYLHPPLFFILTHFFYPFQKPERDLRIFPLIFGTFSIPMLYLLAKQFSPSIALPCTFSLTLMTYHISLSQDGRSYTLIMFLSMISLFFFIKHLNTSKRVYLLFVAFSLSALFYTSYSSIPFIALFQILWFYRVDEGSKKPKLLCFFLLNGLVLFFCLPWILFLILNFKGQPLMHPLQTGDSGSLFSILYWIFHDWVPHYPLMIASIILLILFPYFYKEKRNAILLLLVFLLPIVGLYSFCKLLKVTHFITSRYFISFLPLFFISLYLSLQNIERRFGRIKRFLRLKLIFITLFIASNFIILPLYYQGQKQDLRGLVAYLKSHLRSGDKIFDGNLIYTPGILHYFKNYPNGRHYIVPFHIDKNKGIEFKKSFLYRNEIFNIYYSPLCCDNYVTDGSRLWVIVGKETAKKLKEKPHFILKGYFDGSFLNFNKFPFDASIYLFLYDPKSPDEKGIDMPIE